jgi:hypothetical protein
MSAFLSNLVFLNPWILAGLGALPILWYLLRVTPPAPKHIMLPSAHFLKDLISENQTPSFTPWWLLLLRMLVAAFVILALAHPVYNPAQSLPYQGAVRIVIDDGWESAQTWDQQIRAAEEVLAKAGREGREIFILTTAPLPGNQKASLPGPVTHAKAEAILTALEPKAWPSDYAQITTMLKNQKGAKGAYSFWFGSGILNKGFEDLAAVLQAQGGLTYFKPGAEDLPLVLKPPEKTSYGATISVLSSSATPPGRTVTVQAQNAQGKILDQVRTTLGTDKHAQIVSFTLPESLQAQIAQYRIAGQSGVGGAYILDESLEKKIVGLYGAADQTETKPFIEAQYYIHRALEPFADFHQGDIQDLINQGAQAIILNDVASMAPQNMDALEQWVRKGGLLIRFAGPNMAAGGTEAFLTPVSLQLGGRSLDGSLTWQTPAKLSAFNEKSPLYGIDLHEDITVRQQILAKPSPALEEKTWAQLADGTPLITADNIDRGLVVMIHTTAAPDWSDLPLSGVFVDILKRTLSLAGRNQSQTTAIDGNLQAVWVLDGFARQKAPDGSVQPLPAKSLSSTVPSAIHPPGLYGRGGFHAALNIGPHIKSLPTPENFATGVTVQTYGTQYEQDLLPYLLYLALALLLADWIIMVMMSFYFRIFSGGILRRATAVFVLTALICLPHAASAQSQDDYKNDYKRDMAYADGLYLAYISSGNASVDDTAQRGLENLADILASRTSVEPQGVAKLNPETDELVFFPLIYWPLSAEPLELSGAALKNVQNYLDHGGTILFDTRDQNLGAGQMQETQNARNLRLMTSSLSVPTLEPIPEGHVLSKSFYLLDGYPGLYSDGTLWIESQSASGRDGVSSLIIGGHDWAGAWAAAQPQRSSMRGGGRQQEMAFRFGVNVMMYALTGNYKADQVHVPHILERLGQ